ncbi:nuclear transport factor 2 family protein [Sphaerisporangium corydalis]|uniref:Nuclear transport factor 2 family protein n=1 Tax=Sphaerisporangium corydalis TaxID=1441875 RepID=A0ABV9ER56_9ACTN|nr:nuclear transport factor 2 family protein [Sphaerisporangium corydalis]
MTTTPDVVTRYLDAAEARDAKRLAACFTADGTVQDEGRTYTGHEEIVRWREGGPSEWTYTTTVTGDRPISPERHQVMVRVEGDFPGGLADLTFDFTLREGLVSALRIM